jgi:hypothetical protein
MKLRSPIWDALAEVYEQSHAGRTGCGERDVQPSFQELCDRALLAEGEAYELAISELKSMDGRFVRLEWDHPRARTTIHKVRLSPSDEAAFYHAIARGSPTQRRCRWGAMFAEASEWSVRPEFAAEWKAFCTDRAMRALHWELMDPFRVRKLHEGRHLLDITHRLLNWTPPETGTLIRWVSSHLCGNSKTLETAQASREQLLSEASGGRIPNFESHGILPMPREARIAGPLRLRIGEREFDCAAQEVATLSLADLQQAKFIGTDATRCLTVENKTVFLDLAAKRSGDLIIWTSFPNAATLALLALLPRTLEFWHFGDTDPSGFHILHDLCVRSGLPFRPFRMRVRPDAFSRELTASERLLLERLLQSPHLVAAQGELRALLDAGRVGVFEQEHHQPAPLSCWPFYSD